MTKKTEKRELLLIPKSAFGRSMYEAANETAEIFADLVGQKNNLTKEQLLIIKKLGYEVTIRQEEI